MVFSSLIVLSTFCSTLQFCWVLWVIYELCDCSCRIFFFYPICLSGISFKFSLSVLKIKIYLEIITFIFKQKFTWLTVVFYYYVGGWGFIYLFLGKLPESVYFNSIFKKSLVNIIAVGKGA